jgi:hypothetical protein
MEWQFASLFSTHYHTYWMERALEHVMMHALEERPVGGVGSTI